MFKWFVRPLLFLLALAVAAAAVAAVGWRVINRTNGTLITAPGALPAETRHYLLHVPESVDPGTPTALVIVLHGFAQWPAHQALATHWNALADEEGFIVVYPEGTGFPRRWRAGGLGGDTEKDVAFIAGLIDALSTEYAIDPSRVYANGLSNGGGMAFVLACELADRIAAVGTVAGAYAYPWDACDPARPVPAIVFHGDADPVVPYGGGSAGGAGPSLPDIPAWVDRYAALNGCAGTTDLPRRGEVRGVAYTGCDAAADAGTAAGADVLFYTVEGGGHTWPGGAGIPAFIGGHTTRDIDATREMWAFFEGHRLER